MTRDMASNALTQPASTNRLNKTERIALIVDDDLNFSDMLAARFRQEGYRSVQHQRGEDVALIADVLRPTLISLSLTSRNFAAWSILSDLKRLPFLHHIPVLIISDVDEIGPAEMIGPTSFLLKPTPPAQLIQTVVQLVQITHSPLRILVVDDELLAGELSKSILTPPQFEVHVVRSARAATEWIDAQLPDLVLLDLIMPQTTGFELLASLRADLHTRHLPVLVWTAKHLSASEQYDLTQAAQVVLTKRSFDPARLSETLRYLERVHGFSDLEPCAANVKDNIDMSEFRDDFLREAHEHLGHISGWLNNQDHDTAGDTVEQIMRAAHTLKSAAAIMEMADLSHAAFETETILSCLAKQEVQLDLYTLDTLRLLSDEMQQLLAIA